MTLFRPMDASKSQWECYSQGTSEAGCWNWSANSPGGRERVAPWYAQRWWGVLLCTAYPVAAVAPLAVFTALQPTMDHPSAVEIGADCAIVGFTLVALQFVLAARLSLVEGPFGLDVLVRFHRVMALAAIALLCAHPLLVVGGNGWGLLTRWRVPWYLWVGRSALLVLLLHVGSSLLRRSLPFAYEVWRRWHNIAAFAVLGLGFIHSLAIGNDLRSAAGRVVWAGLLTIAVGAWLYSRILRPLLMRRGWGAYTFRVAAIKAEAPERRTYAEGCDLWQWKTSVVVVPRPSWPEARALKGQVTEFGKALTTLFPGLAIEETDLAVSIQFHAAQDLSLENQALQGTFRSGWDFPPPEGLVPTRCAKSAAIGAKGHGHDRHDRPGRVNQDWRRGLAGRRIPQTHRAVRSGSQQQLAVRAEGHAKELPGVVHGRTELFPGCYIP